MKKVYQKVCTHKFNKKKDQNICIRADLKQKVHKTTFTETKITDWLLIIGKICFFFNTNFIKINLPTYLCLRRNYRLFNDNNPLKLFQK